MKKKLVLTATNTNLCKVFSSGQRVCYNGRNLSISLSDACCAFQTSNLRHLLAVLEKSQQPDWAVKALLPSPFFCLDYDCGAQFSVSLEDDEELVEKAEQEQAFMVNVTNTARHDVVHTNNPTGRNAPLPFLQSLPQDLASALLAAGTEQELEIGELPLQQDNPGKYLYVIKSGLATVLKQMAEGNCVELARLGVGETFGEMSLLSGEPCNASVKILEKSIVTAITGDELDQVMCSNPMLHRFFGHLFMERLKDTNVRLEEELERGMNGRLSMISLMDLLQSLLVSRLTGKFQLKHSMDSGQLYIEEGQIKSANVGDLVSEDAFKEMAKWRDGMFSFQPGTPDDATTNIKVATMQLLMNVAREYDEAKR